MIHTSTRHDIGEQITPPSGPEGNYSAWDLLTTHAVVSLVNTDEVLVVAIWFAVPL